MDHEGKGHVTFKHLTIRVIYVVEINQPIEMGNDIYRISTFW